MGGKLILASFYSPSFYNSKQRLERSARDQGIKSVITFNTSWLKRQKNFYAKNKRILSHSRGAGYWVWKPFIIQRILQRLSGDDVLVYADAGIEILQPVDGLIKVCNEHGGIALFATHCRTNQEWTKRDCFIFMDCDSKEYHKGAQATASFMIMMPNQRSINLVKDWLRFCQNYNILSDAPNICGRDNLPGFVEHRHDQSVLSLLAIKYKLELFREPSQWGNNWKMPEYREDNEFLDPSFYNGGYGDSPWENSPYPTILFNHRSRNPTPLPLLDRIMSRIDSLKSSYALSRLRGARGQTNYSL